MNQNSKANMTIAAVIAATVVVTLLAVSAANPSPSQRFELIPLGTTTTVTTQPVERATLMLDEGEVYDSYGAADTQCAKLAEAFSMAILAEYADTPTTVREPSQAQILAACDLSQQPLVGMDIFYGHAVLMGGMTAYTLSQSGNYAEASLLGLAFSDLCTEIGSQAHRSIVEVCDVLAGM